LAEAARAIDPQARWAGESLSLPTVGVQLHLESFELMRHVSLIASGTKQNLAGWRRLSQQLYGHLQPLRVAPNPRALGLVLLALILLASSTAHMLAHPERLAQAMQEMLVY